MWPMLTSLACILIICFSVILLASVMVQAF